ncbi:MAG: ABC transporter substrate-binding protein [Clostridiales bacterium]|jgi:peptide/nickel transport system substrate-binding protein|nr:ABC transporter substrate-binding protein [Clostridiales bacterium]
MNPTARKLTALSLAAVMGLGLAACSGGSGNGDATGTASPTPGTTAEPASYADQIVVGITAEPKYIEPNAPGMGPAEVQVSQQIFEGLVRTGDDGSIEPVLATDWTISDDGLTYTFNLVQGVKFSNGEDVEPSDWVWSFYRARDYETSNYRYIAEAIDTVEATDEQVVITLTEPNAAFLAELGCFNMVLGDQSYAESMSDEEYLKNPIGTGPYMLKDWTQGSSLTLEANPYYRVEGMPKTKEIKYVLIADDNTRLMQLQSGQIDVAPTFPFSLAQGVESNEALALDIFPSTQIYYLTVNTTKPPFDDVKVRQALYYALNKSELASAIAGEYGTPVAAIVSETQGDWCNTDLQVTEYAPDTAKQMLADAGYTEPVEFTLSIRTGSTFYEQIATLIKSEVDQAGFSCNIELLESATLTDKYSSQSHQATILQWVDDYQDPSGVVGWTVDYDQAQCFYTGLNDEELDALYMAAQTEMDHDKRVEMYRDIQQQVYDNANVIPLYRNDFAFARSAKVDGLQVNPFYVYQAMYWTKAN